MAVADMIVVVLFYACISGAVAAWLLYRRLMSGVRVMVRVKQSGGMEKRYDAVEIGREIRWIQDGEEMTARVREDVLPEYTEHWGLYYRVFTVIDGADEALAMPWLDANLHAEHLRGDEGAKERYRRRVRALNSFRQLAAGLSQLNRWQAAALVILGLFAGLYLSPIIAGALS